MTNLLKETLEILEAHNKKPSDVRWVGCPEAAYLHGIGKPKSPIPLGSWDDFASFADFNYDSGYGGNEVTSEIVIVGDNWWLERGEYDGSEWWEYKTLPSRPSDPTPLRAKDLKHSYD